MGPVPSSSSHRGSFPCAFREEPSPPPSGRRQNHRVSDADGSDHRTLASPDVEFESGVILGYN